MNALQYLNKYFYKYRGRIIIGIVITIASKLFTVFVPEFVGSIVDIVNNEIVTPSNIPSNFKTRLLKNILLIVGTAIIAGLLTFIMRQTLINVSRFIEFDLKNEIYKQYQKLSLNFYKQNRTGDLMNRISEDVGKVRMYVGPAIMYSINTITLFVVVISFMVKESPSLTLYTVIPLPILSVIIFKISQEIHKRSTIVQEYMSNLSAFTQEAFSGISIIKSYGIEPRVQTDFSNLASASKNKHLDLVKIRAIFFPAMILLIGISNIIVIYMGGKQYMDGSISLGAITKFIIYVNMLTWPVATVGWVTSIIQEAEASQKRINAFLKLEPEIRNTTITPSFITGDITFKNVSFTYTDTNITALKNINFKIKNGETLAIIGKTGSGKSTILELIGRLYDTTNGDIIIDNTSITKLNLTSLRTHIGYVPQDVFLFSDTIENNIKFGKENASQDEIITVSKQAQVHKNIKTFNNGYQTVLGERGITLSGGQKQRISIARALIKSPKILLFDDCLSAVDTETEKKILKTLKKVSANKTTIIVSHRISAAKQADKIIVLDAGKITQSGTHETLKNTNGYYKDLYLKQLKEKETK